MTHIRVWRFRPPPEQDAAFVAAYGPDGDWERLFRRGAGYIGTELLRGDDGSYLTIDRWDGQADFDRFQRDEGDAYRALDRKLEGVAGDENFLGAFGDAEEF